MDICGAAKVKVALLLTAVMALVGLTNFLERRNIEKMDATFSSIYHDRLIPATDIFYMTENLFNRRLLMEQFLYSDNVGLTADVLPGKLKSHEISINKLVDKFSKTFLVKNESVELNNFKKGLKITINTNSKSWKRIKINPGKPRRNFMKIPERNSSSKPSNTSKNLPRFNRQKASP